MTLQAQACILTLMTTNTTTTEATCRICQGTGEDPDFGGSCSSCSGATAAPRDPLILSPDENAMGEMADWLGEQKWSGFAQSLSAFYLRRGYLSAKQMDAARRMREKCEAHRASTPRAPEGDRVQAPGVFRRPEDGQIFKVQKSRTSGGLYAKALLPEGGFEYAAGAIRTLTEAMRLTLDEAKAYGRATGMCCVCGTELTNGDSIAAGIGPVCASKW